MPVKEGDKVCLNCGGVNGHKPGCSGESDQVFEIVSTYSRAQAIEDGVLVDCSQAPFDELNRSAGIKVHVAMTAEAFDSYVHPLGVAPFPVKTAQQGNTWELSPQSTQLPPGQTMLGRYWDILWMLRLAMQRQLDDSYVMFRLNVVPNRGGNPEMVELKCVAGPDDEGNVCLTIMLPDQD
jgi:hypothetical protein